MRVQVVDTVGMEEGLRSAFLINMASPSMKLDDIIEIRGDSPSFEDELRSWCTWARKTLLSVEQDGLMTKMRIQF
ncbi:MAG: hypothetical protein JRI47_05740 [Deltaproteobacteria bacterium]|nr:hypothetical protein [Deltaproteobacteria bacterium]